MKRGFISRFRTPRSEPRTSPRGYTLIELVITISIMAIVAAVAVPFFQSYAINANLKSAARDIAADIQNHKQMAVSQTAPVSMVFSVDENSYTVWQGPPKSPAYFGNGISITSASFMPGGTATLTFQSRGTSWNGTIILVNSRGSTATITTNITGRAYVQFSML